MSGRLVQIIVRALDAAARVLGREAELPEHLKTGARGEDEAYFHLRRLGYTVVARNFRSPRRRGELDLVAWEGDVLCFVEVKTRTSRAIKPAEAAVDMDKQHDLRQVAEEYLRHIDLLPSQSTRFDIVSVYFDSGSAKPDFTLFRNAFPVSTLASASFSTKR